MTVKEAKKEVELLDDLIKNLERFDNLSQKEQREIEEHAKLGTTLDNLTANCCCQLNLRKDSLIDKIDNAVIDQEVMMKVLCVIALVIIMFYAILAIQDAVDVKVYLRHRILSFVEFIILGFIWFSLLRYVVDMFR